jgi:hypothetical protein
MKMARKGVPRGRDSVERKKVSSVDSCGFQETWTRQRESNDYCESIIGNEGMQVLRTTTPWSRMELAS